MNQFGTPKIRVDKSLARMIGDLRDQHEKARLDNLNDIRGTLGTPEIRKAAKLREATKNANDRLHWKAGRLEMVGHKFLMAMCHEGEGKAWKELRRREKATHW